MADQISAATTLIEEGTLLPKGLHLESEPFLKGWRLAKNLNDSRLDQRTRETGRRFFCMGMVEKTSLLFVGLVAMVACVSAQTRSTVPAVETIVARMAQARAENRTRFRPYNVTRDYKLFGREREKTKAQVIADIAFIPPDSKKYAIQQANGSGLGGVIVRRMLASEAEVTKDYASTDFSSDNYGFSFLYEEGVMDEHCYVLELLPRRKDKHLLRGKVWVDANTYHPRRFQGELAKNPSWWVRDVRIAFVYGKVGEMWLQTASEASANVRILGPSRMVSRDASYKLNEVVVAASERKPALRADAQVPPSKLRRR